jgi:predicted membrane-bound spermidine synthase
MKQLFSSKLFLLFSFLIGGELISAGLIGIGLLLPVFGVSYFVWLSIFSFSVIAFGIGFLIAGLFSEHSSPDKILLISLLFGGFSIITMPLAAQFLGNGVQSFFGTLLLHESFILFPSFVLCGTSFSCVVSEIDQKNNKQFYNLGVPFFLACLGFVVFLIFDSLYLVPKFGLFFAAILIGIFNSIVPGILIFTIGWKRTGVLFVFVVVSITVFGLQDKFNSDHQNLVYSKTSILKSYQVLDSYTIEGKDTLEANRELIINGTSQCVFPILQKEPNAPLPFSVENEILNRPDVNDKVLLLGICNPALIGLALKKGMDLTIVEPDQTLIDIHTRFFITDKSLHPLNSDFRWYINHAELKYNVVVINAEPDIASFSNLFSVEGIERLKQMLNPGGIILFESTADIIGESGKGNRSIYKTFSVMGLFVKVFKNISSTNNRKILYLISNSRGAFANYLSDKLLVKSMNDEEINVSDALVLTDRRPVLLYLNRFNKQVN